MILIERDNNIDILRFLGLSLIILAHVQCPYYLNEFKCFDVPLMIFVSGLATSKKITSGYWSYICKRARRLIFPVWLFLIVYIPTLCLGQLVHLVPSGYVDLNYIIDSFMLTGGVGYVWIIRVFLLIMLVTPLLVKLEQTVKSNLFYFFIVGILIVTQFLLVHVFNYIDNHSPLGILYSRDIMRLTGYMPLFMIGLRLRLAKQRAMNYFLFIGVILYIATMLVYIHTQGFPISISRDYKYPPHSYYILYGISACMILWPLRRFYAWMSKSRSIMFVSQNTMWIYLWHMPFALFANVIIPQWWMRYLAIYVGAVGCYLIQYFIVNKIAPVSLKRYLMG